eukprot:TRINITY_DN6015_c0_g6_i1.p1 TRINITY_DN6015_c0_g6~~TRINITY_DN6015_c0_g6_i1.p1  ORF type:complete len:345 (-),score=81.09 TRINITY_DN6015_c0_g6_i1:67-1101(-)
MVMEFAGGGELKQHLISKGQQSESEARRILLQLLSAIGYCHSLNVVHRDLKLENILFADAKRRRVKVVDFGIAGLVQDDKAEKSRAGSLRYMAPEVISRENIEARPSLDVWSMGCVLFALVCGELPFSAKSSREIKEKIKKGEFQFPKDCTVSYYCRKLIKSMLTVDYRRRITIKEILQHPWIESKKTPLRDNRIRQSDEKSVLEQSGSKQKSALSGKKMLAKTIKAYCCLPNVQTKTKESFYSRKNADFIKENAFLNKSYHKKSSLMISSNYYDQRTEIPFELPVTIPSKHSIYYPGRKAEKQAMFHNISCSKKESPATVKAANKKIYNTRLNKSELNKHNYS